MLNNTNFANTGKQPHSCPPARRGHILLNASWNAAFHRLTEKVPCCWSPKAGPDTLPAFGVDEPSAGVCMWGVSAWKRNIFHKTDNMNIPTYSENRQARGESLKYLFLKHWTRTECSQPHEVSVRIYYQETDIYLPPHCINNPRKYPRFNLL